MKIILVLLDGIGDRSYGRLGHRTPLQAAHTPNLDRIACLGSNGLFHASKPGQCLPSEIAHYLLFGYRRETFPGRGLLEAVGYGVPFDNDDVMFLTHLAGVTWEKGIPILREKRPDMKQSDLDTLFDAISPFEAKGVRFVLQRTGPHDAILLAKGGASPHVSDSDPMWPGAAMAHIEPLHRNPEPEKAQKTAAALHVYLSHCCKTLSHCAINRERISQGRQPANFLATQRGGRRIAQEPFHRKWGMSGMLVASGALYGGLAHELGLTFTAVQDSEEPGKDLKERISLALSDEVHVFTHVHSKVPDDSAHKKGPELKRDAIGDLDTGLDDLLCAVEERDDLLVAIAADHSTASIPIASIHSGEPVPVIVAGRHVRRDGVCGYDEIQAARGCLGFLQGDALLLMLLNYANRARMVSHRLGGARKPFAPTDYLPFTLKE